MVYVKALAYKKRPTKSETKEWRLNENDLTHNPIDKINKQVLIGPIPDDIERE